MSFVSPVVEVVLSCDAQGRIRHAEGTFRLEGQLRGTFQCSGGVWVGVMEPGLKASSAQLQITRRPHTPTHHRADERLLRRVGGARRHYPSPEGGE